MFITNCNIISVSESSLILTLLELLKLRLLLIRQVRVLPTSQRDIPSFAEEVSDTTDTLERCLPMSLIIASPFLRSF